MMKILTLNTWNEEGPWHRRWELILNEMRILRPDLVAFQELISADWAMQIADKMEFPYFVYPADNAGLMFMSKFPINKWDAITLKTLSPTESYSRAVLLASIEFEGASIVALNTHLSWRLEEGSVRERQIKELLYELDSHFPNVPALAMGDFNAPPNTPEIMKMQTDGRFVDAYDFLYPGRAGFTWDNRNLYTAKHGLPDRRLDYVFVRDEERVFGENGDKEHVSNEDSNLVQILKQQIEEKDEQITELHQLLALAHKNIDSLTSQNQFLLEDMRKPKTAWEKLKTWFGSINCCNLIKSFSCVALRRSVINSRSGSRSFRSITDRIGAAGRTRRF